MARSDRRKVIDFFASQLPGGEAVPVLASGPDGDIAARVEVQGDDLAITSNPWETLKRTAGVAVAASN